MSMNRHLGNNLKQNLILPSRCLWKEKVSGV